MENGKVFQETNNNFDFNELYFDEDIKIFKIPNQSSPIEKTTSISLTEWGGYFNEGFSVNSVNNGILMRREIQREDWQDEVIQLSIENAKDFSFKNSDKKSIGEIQEEIKEDLIVRYHSCEDKAKNIDELFGESKLSVLDDKLLKSDELTKDDFQENYSKEESKNNLNEVTLNSVQLEYPEEKKKEEEKILDDSKQIKIQDEYKSLVKEKELKSREDEIKNLNEKLNQQKFQNKIILDENKKLLEIINIFKILQNLEKTPNSKSTTSLPVEIDELEKDIQNYKSNKQMHHSPKNIQKDDFSDFFDSNNQEQNSLINNLTINSPTKNKKLEDSKPEITDNHCKTYINTNRKKKSSYGDKYKQLSKRKNEVEPHFRQPRHEDCHKPKEFIKTQRKHQENKNWNTLLKSKDEEDLKLSNEKLRIQELLGNNNKSTHNHNNELMEYNSGGFQKNILLSSSYGKFINYNSENTKNKLVESKDSSDFEPIVRKLEKYKEMNDKLMNCLSTEDIFTKIDLEKRKKDVEKLTEILDYLENLRLTQRRQEHMIPFYLVDKHKIYENIVNYINLKNKEKFKHVKRLKSRSPKKTKLKIKNDENKNTCI